MKSVSICAVVMVLCVFCVPVNATILGQVNLSGHNNALSDQSPLYGAGLTGSPADYTGIYSWTASGGTGLGAFVPNWGFCIELPQSPAVTIYDVIPLNEAPLPAAYGTPMGTSKADAIRELWGRHFDSSWLTSPGNKDAEAFSACIWEIIYETDTILDVTSGTGFYATGIENAATANSWLASLNGDANYFAKDLVAVSYVQGQDYVVQIPEPFTLSLLGLGGLALLRRKSWIVSSIGCKKK